MSFAFNFSGDDIEPDVASEGVSTGAPVSDSDVLATSATEVVPVVEHDLKEWLSTLPSNLSYTLIPLSSPLGTSLPLPRRELFDIRAQLMAEDSSSPLLASTSDLSPSLYEGGFKTWESSLDLSSLLLDRGPRRDPDDLVRVAHVVELGCGSALPSTVLFRHALKEGYRVCFTLADFNADVLRLVTLPNLLLGWAVDAGLAPAEGEGELEVTAEVVAGFEAALRDSGVQIRLLSGPWGKELAGLLPEQSGEMTTLVLAAETIYSPQSLGAFVEIVEGVLRRGSMNKAMVAAKRFYFGVGGSTDALKVACAERGMVAAEVENSGLTGMDEGVGRAIVEIQTI
ncbi:hypothetical protein K461DRAFT_318985 [Myriangium duriaei CBS 260.36]|uniref:protein-histidine N-methyltransferase n=1 Tax=Myriangium duriaei CBS 260.36 TaxID=1168546 RepID=A0A9P4J6T4_9PEZI|nr:hypothetical protein K461DRAFT_318985 [Myriangium duriaei CBS 260.36]